MEELAQAYNLRYVVVIFEHEWNAVQVKFHLAFIPHNWLYEDYEHQVFIWIQTNG